MAYDPRKPNMVKKPKNTKQPAPRMTQIHQARKNARVQQAFYVDLDNPPADFLEVAARARQSLDNAMAKEPAKYGHLHTVVRDEGLKPVLNTRTNEVSWEPAANVTRIIARRVGTTLTRDFDSGKHSMVVPLPGHAHPDWSRHFANSQSSFGAQYQLQDPRVLRLVDKIEDHLNSNASGRIGESELIAIKKEVFKDGSIPPRVQAEVYAGLSQLAEKRGVSVDVQNLWTRKLVGKGGEDYIASEGGVDVYLDKFKRVEYTDDERSFADEHGIELTDNTVQSRARIRSLMANEAKTDVSGVDAAFAGGSNEITSLDDLARQPKLGEQTVRALKEGGIQLGDLKAGKVTEARLKKLGAFGPGKVEALRKFFPIPSSPEGAKRKVGRPKNLFGKQSDAFARSAYEPGLVGEREIVVRDQSGALVAQKLPSKLSVGIKKFKAAFEENVAAPFALVKQLGNPEARQIEREAKNLAEVKRATAYRDRVVKAKSGVGASVAQVMFTGHKAVLRTLLVSIVVGSLLFLPWGVFQYAGWLVFGLSTFIMNAAFLLGATIVNMLGTGVVNVVNALGFAMQGGLQAFSNKIPETLGGAPAILPQYNPVPLDWKVTSVLDPNLWFPDCINSNSLGAIGLAGVAGMLHAAAGWVAGHGAFALGFLMLITLGLPLYVLTKGGTMTMGKVLTYCVIGFSFFVMFSPNLGEVRVYAWLVALVIGVGVVFGLMGAAKHVAQDFAGIVAVMTVAGLVAAGGVGYLVFKESFGAPDGVAADGSVAKGGALSGAAFMFQADVRDMIDRVAVTLGSGVDVVGDGAQWLSNAVTTGWAKTLDLSKMEVMRGLIAFGGPEPKPVESSCGV